MAPLAASGSANDPSHTMIGSSPATAGVNHRAMTPAEQLMQKLEDGAPNGGGGSLDFENPAVLAAVSNIEKYGLEREAAGRIAAKKHAADVKRVQLVAIFLAQWKAIGVNQQAEVIHCNNLELQAIYETLRMAGYSETGFMRNGEVSA